LGDLEDARECLVAGTSSLSLSSICTNEACLATIEEPNNLDVKMQLARLYEEMNLQQECMELLTDTTSLSSSPSPSH
jgi:hypothetical protein